MPSEEFQRTVSENKHPLERNPVLYSQLYTYLGSFAAKIRRQVEIAPEQLESITLRSAHIIERNNDIGEIHSTEEFGALIDKEKEELRGPSAIGVSYCIDGRIPDLVLGRMGNVWESKAGIIATEKSPLDGNPQIQSGRLAEAISARARDGQPLLEILFGHFASKTHHDCGAMAEMEQRGKIPQGADKIEANLALLERSATTVTQHYNASVREPKNILTRVAITGLIDTDTMGIVLGHGTQQTFSTTDLATELSPLLNNSESLPIIAGEFQETYVKPEYAYRFERANYLTSKILLELPQFNERIESFIAHSNQLPELTAEQVKALKYILARNVANQWLINTHIETDTPNHNHVHHEELYQSISPDGITVGKFDLGNQAFAAHTPTVADAIDHILTQSTLMDRYSPQQKPYILFISRAIIHNQDMGTNGQIRGDLRDLYMAISQDERIIERIKKGELIPVPVLIDNKTQEIVEVPNFA